MLGRSDFAILLPYFDVETQRTMIDFSKVIRVILDTEFDGPSAYELMETLPASCKYFSTLDLSEGNLQVRLSGESSKMVVVSTKVSSYFKLNVTPLGRKPAVAEFQRRVEAIFEDRCVSYDRIDVDDILIATHMKTLESILASFCKPNVKTRKMRVL